MTPKWLTDAGFVDVLRCPRTGKNLRWMTPSELSAAGEATRRTWEAGVTTPDGAISYPVEDGIFGLLEGLAIQRDAGTATMSGVKRDVQRFYDEIGWHRSDEEKPFGDAELFEDLRPVSRDYIHACHQRVNQHLKRPGRYLLDVASGPIQYPEYLTYGEGFDYRVCVDLSRTALAAARKKLGDERGLFVLGDITKLPLRSDTIDGVVSLHTIYHVPADEQETAFLEVERVLRPGRSAVVVYSWSDSLVTRILFAPAWPIRQAMRIARTLRGATNGALYYHPHSYDWFSKHRWPFSARIVSWRSVPVLPMKVYLHAWLGGSAILRGLQRVEERYPELMGRIGQYPLIIIDKPSQA
jgi:SAM-dependent methyltransferase